MLVNAKRAFLALGLAAATCLMPSEALAGGCHGSRRCGGMAQCRPMARSCGRACRGGRNFAMGFMVSSGCSACFGGGRFARTRFAAPIRRAFGFPGRTPVRQFLFGRGMERRQARRACLFC